MNKAILVIDMPNSCRECPLCGEDHMTYRDYCRITDSFIWTMDKPSWCPLKPVPDKVEVFMDDWADGYNACLEDILEQ